MRLLISQIRTDGGTQARAKIDLATVQEYALSMQEGHRFPPVVVFCDGTDYWLADGFHRLEAHRQVGFRDIEVDLKLGTKRGAILYAVGANASHGLRRTPADKHHAVKLLLEDKEWGQWSDRAIARATVTTHPFVAKIRANLTGNISTERVYRTKHGTEARMDTSRIGKSKTSNPHRWFGIDPGLATVRWAVLEGEIDYQQPRLIAHGTISTAKKRPTPERLLEIEQDLVTLMREFRPGNVALEMPIINVENPQNVRTVLEAVGVIHLVCYREAGIVPVHLYPRMWKSNLGNGWASSEEVTDTIAAMFDLGEQGKTRLDAIGIAYAGFSGVGQ